MNKTLTMISFILSTVVLMGCGASIDHAAKSIVDEIVDQTANVVQSVDENVLSVKGGHPTDYPNITYGDAFENYFGDPTWKSYKGTQDGPDENGDGKPDYTINDVDVVEFTGYCMYQDVKVKALIQFALDKENGTFTTEYLSFNDVPQNLFMLAGVLSDAFETYQNEHGVSTATESIDEKKEIRDYDSAGSTDIQVPETGKSGSGSDAVDYYNRSLNSENTVEGDAATIVVNAPDGGCNFRYGPGVEYECIIDGMIPNGTYLDLYDTSEAANGKMWGYVKYADQFGWVALSQTIDYEEYNDYESSEYIVYGSDTGYFEKDYFEGLSNDELRLARNEIFARHGRTFKDEALQSYFNSKSWYVPVYSPEEFDAIMEDILNDWEKANVQAIKEVEAERR